MKEIWEKYVGEGVGVEEFLNGLTPDIAIKVYCEYAWPHEEYPTQEIKENLLKYIVANV